MSNLVDADFYPQFLIFQKNNSAHRRLSTIILFELLKIVNKNLRILNFSYGKVSHDLN